MKKTIFVRLLYVITVPAAPLVALGAALEPDTGTIQPGFDLLATVPLQTNAQNSVAVNEALNKIYTSGGASSGQDVVVIDGVTFATTDVGSGSGANVDVKMDRYWAATVFGGGVVVRDGTTNNTVATRFPSATARLIQPMTLRKTACGLAPNVAVATIRFSRSMLTPLPLSPAQ